MHITLTEALDGAKDAISTTEQEKTLEILNTLPEILEEYRQSILCIKGQGVKSATIQLSGNKRTDVEGESVRVIALEIDIGHNPEYLFFLRDELDKETNIEWWGWADEEYKDRFKDDPDFGKGCGFGGNWKTKELEFSDKTKEMFMLQIVFWLDRGSGPVIHL